MLSLQVVLAFLFVLQTSSLSSLTDEKPQINGETVPCLCKSQETTSDMLRQLLNQETLVRLALDKKVHDVVKDINEMKETMAKNNNQFQQEVETLKNEVQSLRNENNVLKANALKFEEEIIIRFEATKKNFTEIAKNQDQHEGYFIELFKTEKNTTYILTNINDEVHDLSSSLLVLKSHTLELRNENTKLKSDVLKFQDKMDLKFKVTEENFTQVTDSQEQYERRLNDNFETLEKNTTSNVNSIKTEVRSLSSSLMDLQSRTTELNTTIRDAVDKKMTAYSADWNRSMTEMNHRFVYTWSKMDQDHSNKIMLLSDGMNTTINSIKTDVAQSQKAQLELSSAVSSLEVLRRNMSLLTNSARETRVGFTAGVTSSNSSWQGDILVFPHVVTNIETSYNNSTGVFTAPRAGTYVFFVTVVSYRSNILYLDIVHNGTNKVRTRSYISSRYMTGTNLAVLELSQGDTVWVRRSGGQGYFTDSVPTTTFSGFLL